LALRGVVTLASPHIGVWITIDSAHHKTSANEGNRHEKLKAY
jgi:hypothetical protein